jgi:hypothetical protein
LIVFAGGIFEADFKPCSSGELSLFVRVQIGRVGNDPPPASAWSGVELDHLKWMIRHFDTILIRRQLVTFSERA